MKRLLGMGIAAVILTGCSTERQCVPISEKVYIPEATPCNVLMPEPPTLIPEAVMAAMDPYDRYLAVRANELAAETYAAEAEKALAACRGDGRL